MLDVIQVDGSWFAYLADVSGHGVAAGVLMTIVKSAARMRLASTRAERFLERLTDKPGVIAADRVHARRVDFRRQPVQGRWSGFGPSTHL